MIHNNEIQNRIVPKGNSSADVTKPPERKEIKPPVKKKNKTYQGFDPHSRELGLGKEILEQEVYGKFFKGKKKFVKEYEEQLRENRDVEI